MQSLWRSNARTIETDPAPPSGVVDDIVVGAGLTGLVTALLLAREGRRVLVLEARDIGAVTTGNSTAKVSLLQGAQLQKIRARTYPAIVRAYVDANRAGQDWLLDYAASRGIAVQRRDAVSYASHPEGFRVVEKEYRIARDSGLDARLSWNLDLPFDTYGAVVLRGQAQLDPLDVLACLVEDIRALGGTVLERARVTGVAASRPVVVSSTAGDFEAQRAHLTTGTPILDRGLYFAKLSATRSYAASFRGVEHIPDGMYLSVDDPKRSIRAAPDADGELLLVGGGGHGVGRAVSPRAIVDDLLDWTRARFPGAEPTHEWSAQDYSTPHGVPFVGWLPRGRGRIFLATGYDKWGMTNAAAAALTLTGDLLGKTPPWAKILHRRATLPPAIAASIGENAAVAAWAARGWFTALTAGAPPAQVPEGEGVLGHRGLHPQGVSRVGDTVCAVSAVCPHLGGVVSWNDAEKSWDCPLHGSRFSASGENLEGPATRPLRRVN